MEIVIGIFVVLHLLGLAAIIGSAVFVARGKVTPALVWGARAQIITGLILVGLNQANNEEVNNLKIAVKFVIALAVVACAEIANARSKKDQPVSNLVTAAGILAVINVIVAVMWTSG